jgi:hypothetical protein
MDRLHAFCYFLEGLLPWANQEHSKWALVKGIGMAREALRANSTEFVRSDVYAQLLRAQLFAKWADVLHLDFAEMSQDAAALASFQRDDGGWWFGRKHGEMMPFINPVSAAFASQALDLWERREPINRHLLV